MVELFTRVPKDGLIEGHISTCSPCSKRKEKGSAVNHQVASLFIASTANHNGSDKQTLEQTPV